MFSRFGMKTGFHGWALLQSHLTNSRIVFLDKPQLLYSASFPFHYSLIILSFYGIYPNVIWDNMSSDQRRSISPGRRRSSLVFWKYKLQPVWWLTWIMFIVVYLNFSSIKFVRVFKETKTSSVQIRATPTYLPFVTIISSLWTLHSDCSWQILISNALCWMPYCVFWVISRRLSF